MEQPEDPPGVGHQIQDFKFDFTTAYIIEIRKRAENRWAMYAEHNKQNPDSIPALTPQEVKIMQNTSICDTDRRKCELGLKALQYGLDQEERKIECDNNPSHYCQICLLILGVKVKHYHISERKLLIRYKHDFITMTEIQCGVCGENHMLPGPRQAICIIDIIFGTELPPHLEDPDPTKQRHIDLVSCRVHTMGELIEILYSEIACMPRQVDVVIAIEWGHIILSYVHMAEQKGVTEYGALLELRDQVIVLMLEIVEGATPFPLPMEGGRPSTVWFSPMPYTPEFTKWYDNDNHSTYVPPGMPANMGTIIRHPEHDIHRLLVLWNNMLIDINMLMMQLTDIRTYTKNTHNTFVPGFQGTGIHKFEHGDPGIRADAAAYNKDKDAGFKDIRETHILKTEWSSNRKLRPEAAAKCKRKLYNFFNSHVYSYPNMNELRHSVETTFGPRQVAYLEILALNSREKESTEERRMRRAFVDDILNRNEDTLLHDDRVARIMHENSIEPTIFQPDDEGNLSPTLRPPTPEEVITPPESADLRPPTPEEVITPPESVDLNENVSQSLNKMDNENPMELSSSEEDLTQDVVIVSETSDSEQECSEDLDQLPQIKKDFAKATEPLQPNSREDTGSVL